MSISNQIQSCLTEQGIQFTIISGEAVNPLHQLRSANEVTSNAIVTMVVLEDSIGKIQLLMPANSFLDLTHLCEVLGRNFQGITQEASTRLAEKHGAEKIPAIPLLNDIPTVVDKALLNSDKLYLEVGNSESYLELSQQEFLKLVETAESGNYCIPTTDLTPQNTTNKETNVKQINQAVEQFTTLRIQQRLEQTLEMPPLPETAERIIQLRINPEAGVGELAEVVEKDPSLAAQVVSWASSPYYAAPGTIKSVHDAVVRVLGFDLVINLALGLSLGKTVEIPNDGPHGITPYWQQAVCSAAMMEGLVKAMSPDARPSMGLAYLSGLLHNYGYLVLAHIFPPYFSLINRYIEANPHVCHVHVEHHLLGVTRDQIGGALMECWNMPEEVVTALRYQHSPNHDDKHAIYSQLLSVATQAMINTGLIQGPKKQLDAALLTILTLDADDVEAVVQRLVESKDDLMSMARTLEG